MGREVIQFVGLELRRALTSSKGLVLILLYGLTQILGGILFAALQQSPLAQVAWNLIIQGVAALQSEDPTVRDGVAHFLSQIPPSILFAYYFSLFTVPALVLLMGFDQVAGELSHRSVRYVAFRARRISWVVGKTLSQVVLLMGLTLFSNVVVLGFAAALSPTFEAGPAVEWTLHLWLLTSAYGVAYVALVTAVSSLFREPFLALGVGASALFGLWVAGLLSHTESLHPVRYVLPATYAGTLLSPDLGTSLGSAGVLGLFTLVFMVASIVIIQVRDL